MKYENALQRAIKGRLERAMELAELFGLLIILAPWRPWAC